MRTALKPLLIGFIVGYLTRWQQRTAEVRQRHVRLKDTLQQLGRQPIERAKEELDARREA